MEKTFVRHFDGVVCLEEKDYPVPVSFHRNGDLEDPVFIVTSRKSELGMILKSDPNTHTWFNISRSNLDLDSVSRIKLEKALNEIIQQKGVSSTCC